MFKDRWKRAKVMRGSTGEIKGKRDAAEEDEDDDEDEVAVACDLESNSSMFVRGPGRFRKRASPGEGVEAGSVEEELAVARCNHAVRCPGGRFPRAEPGDSALYASSAMVTCGVPGMGRRAVGAPSLPSKASTPASTHLACL